MEPMLRKLRVLWLELDCSNLNPDLVHSIAHWKATDYQCPSYAHITILCETTSYGGRARNERE